MAIQIGRYNFEGPYNGAAPVLPRSGVYVIVGRNVPGHWNVVDIGESVDIRDRLSKHDRGGQWKRQPYSSWGVAVFYADERNRMAIGRELRTECKPACGER